MPKKGGKRTKSRTHESGPPPGVNLPSGTSGAEERDVPRSIVAKANKVSPIVGELVRDIRKLMGPYTATNLREKSYNRMKDYSAVAGQLGITHLVVVSQTQQNVIMRLGRFPDGPTLHFRINAYSLSRQVRATQRRPYDSPAAFMTPPLVVLNNFSQSVESHTKLMRVTFQHMFPTINIKTVKLSECRRVVLFHLMEDGNVEMRHYAVRANPVGVSKSVKRIIEAKLPDLGSLEDISEYIEGTAGMSGFASDSEAEDEGSRVTLPDRFIGKGNAKSQQSAMKLTELGPRLTLEIFKVEQGVNEGDVLYHKFVHKTPAEAAKIKAKIEKSKRLKEDRKATQEANVKRKREAEAEKRQAKIDRKRRKIEGANGEQEGGVDSDSGSDNDGGDADDDENQYGEYDGIENDGEYSGEEDDDSDQE
eukprot:CAMPEP_0184980784 /NCGR_PEP_ID=MMETSP1098-20130426/10674_1 /TAXON_ID=89044 /ORGANISM="Spumella elongata, Strain CCAP 955/1" /LENGTH=419 /DNA_ID=CAMNT_0027504265 /DNA_START=86 /DNA_END=1345 /DNA_ORIENTATION=+